MLQLSGDPYEAARRAFFSLNPNATDEDWDRWIAKHTTENERGFDDFAALAQICSDSRRIATGLTAECREHICFAEGFFQAMERSVFTIWMAQPVSAHVPQHMTKYRRGLAEGSSQFKD